MEALAPDWSPCHLSRASPSLCVRPAGNSEVCLGACHVLGTRHSDMLTSSSSFLGFIIWEIWETVMEKNGTTPFIVKGPQGPGCQKDIHWPLLSRVARALERQTQVFISTRKSGSCYKPWKVPKELKAVALRGRSPPPLAPLRPLPYGPLHCCGGPAPVQCT